uniref:Uncharacterized protein n=1 Tax=Meloidogyne hapla TaxID=6305 RepID=A0A1I8BH31_MELHA
MRPSTWRNNEKLIFIPITNTQSNVNNEQNLNLNKEEIKDKLKINSFATKKKRSKRKYKNINYLKQKCLLNESLSTISENNFDNSENNGECSSKRKMFDLNLPPKDEQNLNEKLNINKIKQKEESDKKKEIKNKNKFKS